MNRHLDIFIVFFCISAFPFIVSGYEINFEKLCLNETQYEILPSTGERASGSIVMNKEPVNGTWYRPDMNCSVTLITEESFHILLTFSNISLRNSSMDNLTVIYNGDKSSIVLANQQVCSNENCEGLKFDSGDISNLTLIFVSANVSVPTNVTGFKAQYTVYRAVDPNTGACRGKSKFLCENRHCIPYDLVCDGHNNCGDFSDETKCSIPISKTVWAIVVIVVAICSVIIFVPLFIFLATSGTRSLVKSVITVPSQSTPLLSAVDGRENAGLMTSSGGEFWPGPSYEKSVSIGYGTTGYQQSPASMEEAASRLPSGSADQPSSSGVYKYGTYTSEHQGNPEMESSGQGGTTVTVSSQKKQLWSNPIVKKIASEVASELPSGNVTGIVREVETISTGGSLGGNVISGNISTEESLGGGVISGVISTGESLGGKVMSGLSSAVANERASIGGGLTSMTKKIWSAAVKEGESSVGNVISRTISTEESLGGNVISGVISTGESLGGKVMSGLSTAVTNEKASVGGGLTSLTRKLWSGPVKEVASTLSSGLQSGKISEKFKEVATISTAESLGGKVTPGLSSNVKDEKTSIGGGLTSVTKKTWSGPVREVSSSLVSALPSGKMTEKFEVETVSTEGSTGGNVISGMVSSGESLGGNMSGMTSTVTDETVSSDGGITTITKKIWSGPVMTTTLTTESPSGKITKKFIEVEKVSMVEPFVSSAISGVTSIAADGEISAGGEVTRKVWSGPSEDVVSIFTSEMPTGKVAGKLKKLERIPSAEASFSVETSGQSSMGSGKKISIGADARLKSPVDVIENLQSKLQTKMTTIEYHQSTPSSGKKQSKVTAAAWSKYPELDELDDNVL